MRALEGILFALMLIAVPAAAWALGRFSGRRDWPIVPVLASGAALAVAVGAVRLVALVLAESLLGAGRARAFRDTLGD